MSLFRVPQIWRSDDLDYNSVEHLQTSQTFSRSSPTTARPPARVLGPFHWSTMSLSLQSQTFFALRQIDDFLDC